MAFTLDMTKRTVSVCEAPAGRAKREPDPNPLEDFVANSYTTNTWQVIEGVPTVENIEVENFRSDGKRKISEAVIIERMLRRAARTLGYGIAISIKPNAKKGMVDIFFHAQAKRQRRTKVKD